MGCSCLATSTAIRFDPSVDLRLALVHNPAFQLPFGILDFPVENRFEVLMLFLELLVETFFALAFGGRGVTGRRVVFSALAPGTVAVTIAVAVPGTIAVAVILVTRTHAV